MKGSFEMIQTNNLNILDEIPLPSPEEIRQQFPLSAEAAEQVSADRQAIRNILNGKDVRLLVITGPCSIHNGEAALEYARRLRVLQKKYNDRLMIVMRAYFEKPRTTIGWKGLIYDPDLNLSYNIASGVQIARSLLQKLLKTGLPAATEMLDPILAQYTADSISWAAIGARTTEAQTHRQLASGLSMPVGFKNATDGTVQTAIDAVATAKSPHSFLGVQENGRVGIFRTKGNPDAHVVLRGGIHGPNYAEENLAFLKVALKKAHLTPNVVIDCSHGNSCKDYRRQGSVLRELLRQIGNGEELIRGVMLESNLKPGKQSIEVSKPVDPELSITDSCIGWEETEALLAESYEKMACRF